MARFDDSSVSSPSSAASDDDDNDEYAYMGDKNDGDWKPSDDANKGKKKKTKKQAAKQKNKKKAKVARKQSKKKKTKPSNDDDSFIDDDDEEGEDDYKYMASRSMSDDEWEGEEGSDDEDESSLSSANSVHKRRSVVARSTPTRASSRAAKASMTAAAQNDCSSSDDDDSSDREQHTAKVAKKRTLARGKKLQFPALHDSKKTKLKNDRSNYLSDDSSSSSEDDDGPVPVSSRKRTLTTIRRATTPTKKRPVIHDDSSLDDDNGGDDDDDDEVTLAKSPWKPSGKKMKSSTHAVLESSDEEQEKNPSTRKSRLRKKTIDVAEKSRRRSTAVAPVFDDDSIPESDRKPRARNSNTSRSRRDRKRVKRQGDLGLASSESEEEPQDTDDEEMLLCSPAAKAQVRSEVEELKDNFPDYDRKPRKDAGDSLSENSNQDDNDTRPVLPPIPPLCDKCLSLDLMQEHTTHDTGEVYYKCRSFSCGRFMWPTDAMTNLPSGPSCHCGLPSAPIRVTNSGECIWVCPRTSGANGSGRNAASKPCGYEKTINEHEDVFQRVANNAAAYTSSQNDDVEFACGAVIKNALQNLLHVSAEETWKFNKGQDVRERREAAYYDYVEVQRAWRVISPDEHLEAFQNYRTSIGEKRQGEFHTDTLISEAAEQLVSLENGRLEPLDRKSNELFLLHGTKPKNVASILEKSLDPGLAGPGLFGSGTYFAESAVKIDQYVQVDEEYCGGNRHGRYGERCELHNKLYPQAEWHPGEAYYALVCRVVTGKPRTDGSYPAENVGCDSVLAVPAGSELNLREFVVYDKSAIKIEYVVCYTRERHYCYCEGNMKREVRERTFGAERRKCIACPNSRRDETGNWTGGCGLFAPLPRCFCKRDNKVDFYGAVANESRNRYECERHRCGFNRLIHQGVDLREAEDESIDNDEYDQNDSFIASEDDVEDEEESSTSNGTYEDESSAEESDD